MNPVISPESYQVAAGPGAGGGFGGGGFGAFGLVGLIGLLGRRGLGGGDDDCPRSDNGGGALGHIAILQKLGDIQNEIATDSCDVQAAIAAATSSLKDSTQNQTLFLQGILNTNQLSGLQALANVKDTVQAGIAINTQQLCNLSSAMQEGFCEVKTTVHTDGEATRALINAINSETLNRQLTDAKNELIELRTEGRSRGFARETEVTVTQNVNQNQQQQQQQQQFNDVHRRLNELIFAFEIQNQRQQAANRTVQFGTGNIATPSNTNTANQVG